MSDGTYTMVERRKASPNGAGHYHISDHYPYRVRVSINDQEVASTSNAIILKEVGKSVYNPGFYIPAEDVKKDLFKLESGFTTHCPIKGEASYWGFVGGPEPIERVAWSYEAPLEYSAMIAKHLGFDQRFATIEISPASSLGNTMP